MIPASVTPSVSANASSAGALFPLMDPTSAELAEFDQLLGDFNQGTRITALSMPALTLSNNASFVTSNEAKTPVTPEGLLSTLEQGAQLALQVPQVGMVIPMNQSLSDEQTTPLLQKTSVEGSSNIPDETQNHAMGLLAASNQVGDQTSTTLLNQKINPSNASLTLVMTSPVVMPQRKDISLIHASDNVYRTSYIPTLADVSATNNLAVTTGNAPNTMSMPNQQIPLPEQNKEVLATTIGMATSEVLPIEALSTSLQASGTPIAESLTTSTRSMPLSYVQLLTPANLQVPETKVTIPNQYAVAPVAVTTPTLAVATENSMVSQLTEGAELPVSVPLLGDNKAVVFASLPSSSVASSGVMQAASTAVEIPSTSQMLNSLATTIVASSTAGSNSGSTQQDQRQESSQSDRLMQSLEEAQSISDVELGADEFSLVSTTALNQTTSSSILSAPLNLRQPQWAQDVAQRVQVMINQSMNELEVRLDPLGLGPMKIGLKLDEQHKAHVRLSAQHGVTREMLENALPRLKELLAQEGIELASATVDSGEKQTGNGQNSAQSSYRSASDLPEDAANATVAMTVIPSSEHLVDQFA